MIRGEAFAPSTRKTRQSQWNRYYDFCNKFGLPRFPILAENVCRFLVFVSNKVCYTTLNNYVSSLNLLLRMQQGKRIDLRDDFGVILTLRGLKRILGAETKSKEPLYPEELLQIFQFVCLDKPCELSVWLGILLCFRSLLRKGHFFADDVNECHLLTMDDIVFCDWGFQITVNSSKTIQFKERSFVIPIRYCVGDLCVASQLKLYFERFPRRSTDPVLGLCKNGVTKPISYNIAISLLKKWCGMAGIHKDVGFHSLRRGAASHMHSIGVSLVDIKTAGDWQSMCVLRYLSVSSDRRKEMERKFASSLL